MAQQHASAAHGASHGHSSVKSYVIGFVLAVILTVIPFKIVMDGSIDAPPRSGSSWAWRSSRSSCT